jgi:hypothetical protein
VSSFSQPPRGKPIPMEGGGFAWKPLVERWVPCARAGCPERAYASVTATSIHTPRGARPGALLITLRVCESDVDWARSLFSQPSITQEGQT